MRPFEPLVGWSHSLWAKGVQRIQAAAGAPTPRLTNYFVAGIATSIVQFLLGGTLIYGAPVIAARFYPPGSDGEDSRRSVGPGDVYRTACFVLGAYLLVHAAEPAGKLVIAGVQGNRFPVSLASDAVTAIVYAASGLLLVFGSRPIANMLSHLRYDPDTIPKQQFSLAMLLVFLVLVAVILGVIRRMSVGPM